MKYKREEYFRYAFGEPIPTLFRIEKVNGKVVETSKGEGEILDLSPKGMKFATKLMIANAKRNEVQLSMFFTLNDADWNIACRIVWAKENNDFVEYGVEFLPGQEIAVNLVKQLKLVAKKQQKK